MPTVHFPPLSPSLYEVCYNPIRVPSVHFLLFFFFSSNFIPLHDRVSKTSFAISLERLLLFVTLITALHISQYTFTVNPRLNPQWHQLLVSIWEPPTPVWVSSEMTELRSLPMTRVTERHHHLYDSLIPHFIPHFLFNLE